MDIPNPPEHIREKFRCALLEGDEWGLLAANRAYEEFADLRRYALKMEQLVDHAEQAEIEDLRPEADALDDDDRGEFWAWHYPVHWDQVVRGMFRASTVTVITSFVETTLSQICRDVQLITQEELRPSDINGGVVEKRKKYLARFGGFALDRVSWKRIEDIVQIRNALVHANGSIEQCKNSSMIRGIISENKDLNEVYGAVSINKGYLEYCLGCVEDALSSLSTEMTELCSRQKRLSVKT
ncbi:hypothetical protein [Spectribacter hydrogenoxidans]|uniref:RiboL-PSP-HEPN domain-containing protein n=1 Tax=Spectribacter hydrogenoxidans TaxID=3075608 RepID=A0ABU3BZ00_9GAMM|nr:hypothetical protein [Salinisphaera sp. W335]MDT0634546.1 hypothetical protein [Salinisphaera sp. W335]